MSAKNNFFTRNKYLNCRGKLVSLHKPCVMGIINLSPESFYQGSKFTEEMTVLHKVEEMLDSGATFIDIGGMSSRPGSDFLSVETELNRVLPVLKSVVKNFPDANISIDTFRSAVAELCLNEGAAMINDISAGLLDDKLPEVILLHKAPYVMMHMKGTPKTMQEKPRYENIMDEVLDYFIERVTHLKSLGVQDLVIDPGFGFGKSLEHNYTILNRLAELQVLGLPILAGISRKSMIWKVIGKNADQALNGSTALHMAALMNGANILRVHDVSEAIEAIRLFSMIDQ